ncbi:MAG: hypothetical protein PSV16_03695 [Flavobacterium sp.]|nr:hypothetical protein [Flavobacterium sp.]
MRKSVFLKGTAIVFLLCFGKANAQSEQTLQELGNLINDAIFFTDQYITPATDAAVYQAASGWVATPKEAKRWDFTLGVHVNTFFVPKSDRSFHLADSDLSFFTIEGVNETETPTALGNANYATLTGTLNNEPVTLKTPEGIDRETIIYPSLQGALGIGFGTEVIAKFSPKITLKHVEYQVYGLGLKHNFSRYFKNLEAKKIHLSTLLAYSREDVTVAFLDVTTSYGNLGLNSLNSIIDTWQLQFNGSKEFKKLEVSAGLIMNTSKFEYTVDGERGAIEDVIPLHQVLNQRLEAIYKTKFNCIGEVSGRYDFGKIYLQSTVAFGKFVNTNIALQYEF